MTTKVNKADKQAVQRVSKELLNAGVYLQEVILHKEDEKSANAFERYIKTFLPDKQVMEVVKGVFVTIEDMKEYCKWIDNEEVSVSRYLSLPHSVPLSTIEDALKRKLGIGWRELKYKDKMEVLWHLGMNTRADQEEASKYYVVRRLYRDTLNKVKHGLVVVGQERTDKAWLKSGKSSLEAYMYTKDKELGKDLKRMSKQ